MDAHAADAESFSDGRRAVTCLPAASLRAIAEALKGRGMSVSHNAVKEITARAMTANHARFHGGRD